MTAARKWALAGMMFALAFLAHSKSITYGFTSDEQLLVRDNPTVHNLANLRPILLDKFWPGPTRGIYYRPLTTLSYALDYALAKDAPWIYHLTNVMFHALASALILLLLLRLATSAPAACFAAFVFALHPIHVEAVDWVPGRTDIIATLFLVAAWLALLSARDRHPIAGAAVSAFLFLLALAGKESAAVLPALVILHDGITEKARLRLYWLQYAALALPAVIYFLLRHHALAGPGLGPAPDPIRALGPAGFIGSLILIPGLALRLILLPTPWKMDYAYDDLFASRPGGAIILSALALAALIFAVIQLRKQKPVTAFALAAFLITLAPVSHLIPFPTSFAERFLYLPSLFLVLALAELIFGSKPRRAIVIAAVAVVILLSLNRVGRGRPFANELSFWRAAVSEAPDRAAARNWLGIAYRNRGEWKRAEAQYRKALELDPGYTVAAMNLAEIFLRQQRNEEAVGLWERLLSDDPANPDLHYNLLMYYLRAAPDCARAREHLTALRRLRPDHPALPAKQAEVERTCPSGGGGR